MDSFVRRKLDKFFGDYKLSRFEKGELLVRAGVAPGGVFYLVSGAVRQYSVSSSVGEFVVNIFKAPSFFPMPWVVNGSLPRYKFEAMTNGACWCAPRFKFLEFFKHNPEVLLDLIKRIYKGLEGYTLRLESLLAGSAYTRLVVSLLINAGRFGDRLRLSQEELASQTGIRRETVNREIRKLKDKGLVKIDGNSLVVKNLDKLEKELGF